MTTPDPPTKEELADLMMARAHEQALLRHQKAQEAAAEAKKARDLAGC